MPTPDWLNREAAFRTAAGVPTRVLRPHATGGRFGDAQGENLLVQGDNLEAMKALLPFYCGQVKCIFIDPPYNTKSAFEHYDDDLEHSQWLSMMLLQQHVFRGASARGNERTTLQMRPPCNKFPSAQRDT